MMHACFSAISMFPDVFYQMSDFQTWNLRLSNSKQVEMVRKEIEFFKTGKWTVLSFNKETVAVGGINESAAGCTLL